MNLRVLWALLCPPILCLFWSLPAFAGGLGIEAQASAGAYNLYHSVFGGQTCSAANTKDLTALDNAAQVCSLRNSKTSAHNRDDLNAIEDHTFFNIAAQKESQLLACRDDRLKELTQQNKLSKIEDTAIKDLESKLPELRRLTQAISDDKRAIQGYDAGFGDGQISPGTEAAQYLRDSEDSVKKDLARDSKAYAQLYETLWSSNDPSMSSYLNKVINSNISVSDYDKAARGLSDPGTFSRNGISNIASSLGRGELTTNFSFRQDAVLQMQKDDENELNSLNKAKRGAGYSLSDSQKREIYSDSGALSSLGSKNLSGLACRLDARYGSGPEIIKNTAIVATAVASLFTGLGPILSESALVAGISQGAATVIALSDGAWAVANVVQACGTLPSSILSENAVCTMKGMDWQNAEIKKIDNGDCALSLAATAVAVVAPIVGAKVQTYAKNAYSDYRAGRSAARAESEGAADLRQTASVSRTSTAAKETTNLSDEERVAKAEKDSLDQANDLRKRNLAETEGNFDCDVVNEYYANSFPAGSKNCTKIKAKEDIKGEYCACSDRGQTDQNYNFLFQCPAVAGSYKSSKVFAGDFSLNRGASRDFCTRVTIPKGKECIAGSTAKANTETVFGRGGAVQLYCPNVVSARQIGLILGDGQKIKNDERVAQAAAKLKEKGLDIQPSISLKPEVWSPFSDFSPLQSVVQKARDLCSSKCSPQAYEEIRSMYDRGINTVRNEIKALPTSTAAQIAYKKEVVARAVDEQNTFKYFLRELQSGQRGPSAPPPFTYKSGQ